jgi:hypothetical protein
MVVVISPERDQQIESERRARLRRAGEAIERIAELNKDTDPAELDRLVDEVVEEVRQERYERRKCQTAGVGALAG